MEVIKNNDYVLYNDVVGKVEIIVGDTIIANINGVKVKDHISKFKKWDTDKIHRISKEEFIITMGKVLDKEYLMTKYPNLSKSDIELLLTSGMLIIQNFKDELFK